MMVCKTCLGMTWINRDKQSQTKGTICENWLRVITTTREPREMEANKQRDQNSWTGQKNKEPKPHSAFIQNENTPGQQILRRIQHNSKHGEYINQQMQLKRQSEWKTERNDWENHRSQVPLGQISRSNGRLRTARPKKQNVHSDRGDTSSTNFKQDSPK